VINGFSQLSRQLQCRLCCIDFKDKGNLTQQLLSDILSKLLHGYVSVD